MAIYIYPIKRDLINELTSEHCSYCLETQFYVCCVGGETPIVLTANDTELYKFIFRDVCMFTYNLNNRLR